MMGKMMKKIKNLILNQKNQHNYLHKYEYDYSFIENVIKSNNIVKYPDKGN